MDEREESVVRAELMDQIELAELVVRKRQATRIMRRQQRRALVRSRHVEADTAETLEDIVEESQPRKVDVMAGVRMGEPGVAPDMEGAVSRKVLNLILV